MKLRNKSTKGILRSKIFIQGILILLTILFIAVAGILSIHPASRPITNSPTTAPEISQSISEPISDLPSAADYNGKAYVIINRNQPYFTSEEKLSIAPFEIYSPLDSLGRCGVAYANICLDLMPTEPRGEIGHIKPTGWHLQKYDIIEDKYLYNRCHLIGYQLAGENDNPLNLITGTRYLNIQGMLDAENMIANYVKRTGNHVLYRVTPVFKDNNLLAEGVLMEAWSVEDGGKGVCFNLFAFNVQPGIEINYMDGSNHLASLP